MHNLDKGKSLNVETGKLDLYKRVQYIEKNEKMFSATKMKHRMWKYFLGKRLFSGRLFIVIFKIVAAYGSNHLDLVLTNRIWS